MTLPTIAPWEWILYSNLILVLLAFVFYLLSLIDIFFGQNETGDIRFIVAGKSFRRLFHGVVRKKFNHSNNKFEDGKEHRPWFFELLGIFWIGIPPFRKMHYFTIEKTKENSGGQTPEQWITQPVKEVVGELRFQFPRSFVLMNVEVGSVSRVHVLVNCKFEVVNPIIPVFVLKGDFFRNAEGIVGANVTDILNNLTSVQAFVQATKGEALGLLAPLKIVNDNPTGPDDPIGHCNRSLEEQVGLRLIGISISKADPGNQDIIDAASKEEVARLLGLATIAESTAYATSLGLKTKADAERLIELAKGQGALVRETVAAMKKTGKDEKEISRAVAEILKFRSLSESTTITTYVDKGGDATPTIPVKP